MASYEPPRLHTLRDIVQSTDQPAIIEVASKGDDGVEPATKTITHIQLRNLIATYATKLASTIAPKSVVAIVMPNSTEFIISFLATTSAAFVAAPLNAAYTTDEFCFYLTDAGVGAVLIKEDMPSDNPIRTAASQCAIPLLTFPPSLLSAPFTSTESEPIQSECPTGETTALFLHTSGTTSRPKGVPLTHTNLVTSVSNISATYELTPADRTLLVMPLFHVHGLLAGFLSTLATGGAIILPPGGKFSASAFWPAARAGQASWYTAVPTMHQILLARADKDYDETRAPNLRFIRSCSASLAASVLERLESCFHAPVLEAYAMTEAAHQMTSNPLPKFGVRKPGSVGLPQCVDVAVLDASNSELGRNQGGEVCIRGRNVTAGYHNNAAANEAAFSGGWFHTGDQGMLDEDGFLTLTGRIKELVNRGGEKISPLEVDAALLAHTDVAEAVSFAVPDEKYGEEVNAAVILKEGSSMDSEQLTAFAKGKLAPFKIPKRFFFCDDLPRTATGKIQRRIVSKHFLDKLKDEKA